MKKNHNEFLAACENFLWQKKKQFLQAAANSIYHHYTYKHAFRQQFLIEFIIVNFLDLYNIKSFQ